MKIILWRDIYTAKQTQGRLYVGNINLATIELPWLSNKKGISCIPSNSYKVKKTLSKRLKIVTPEILNVPGRTGIRMHPANYVTQLEGCIAPGMDFRDLNEDGLLDVWRSVEAFNIIMDNTPDEFTIEIRAGA